MVDYFIPVGTNNWYNWSTIIVLRKELGDVEVNLISLWKR